MAKQVTDIDTQIESLDEHIHMLGCQAMTKARNLGYAEAKGEKSDDKDLLEMIDKHEELLAKAIKTLLIQSKIDELEKLPISGVIGASGFRIDGTREWQIKDRIKELQRGIDNE